MKKFNSSIISFLKNGKIIKGQGGIGRGLKLNLQNIPQSSNPTAVDNARKINQAGINASVKDNGERYAVGADKSNDYTDDPYVAEYFEKDVIPRYMREHPNATKQELDALRQAYHYPQKSGELNPFYGGTTSYNGGTPTITYNESRGNPNRTTVVHENTHAYRYGIDKVRPSYNYGFNSKEEELLNGAYSMDNYSDTIHSVAEMGATNAEIRYVYWKKLYDTLGRVPTLEEMDNYINSLPLGTLERVERGVNNYGRHSINEQRDDRSNMFVAPGRQKISEMERRKRDALIHVADNSEQTDMANLAKQGCKLRFKSKLHK